MVIRCNSCNQEIEMFDLTYLDETCEHCGEDFNYSMVYEEILTEGFEIIND